MAYKRTETTDGVTKMSRALYDNLQDGIDELREEVGIDDATNSGDTAGDGNTSTKGESIKDVLYRQEIIIASIKTLITSISDNLGGIKFIVTEDGKLGIVAPNSGGEDGDDEIIDPFGKNDISLITHTSASGNSGGSQSMSFTVEVPEGKTACLLIVSFGNARSPQCQLNGATMASEETNAFSVFVLENLTVDSIIRLSNSRSNTSQYCTIAYIALWF